MPLEKQKSGSGSSLKLPLPKGKGLGSSGGGFSSGNARGSLFSKEKSSSPSQEKSQNVTASKARAASGRSSSSVKAGGHPQAQASEKNPPSQNTMSRNAEKKLSSPRSKKKGNVAESQKRGLSPLREKGLNPSDSAKNQKPGYGGDSQQSLLEDLPAVDRFFPLRKEDLIRSSLVKKPLEDGIYVFGAREHNLKSLNVFIPRNKISLITGLSGSGKSSLAFDTIYGEGRRRYLESLSVYARYFIDQMKRPDVDFIYGLSPAIAINQKAGSFNPRSTVGTLTESYDFLRLLYAKVGKVFCPIHKKPLQAQKAEEIKSDISARISKSGALMVLSPIARGKKGEFSEELERCLSMGFDQARIDGRWLDLGAMTRLERRKDHYIDIMVDRITAGDESCGRLDKAVDQALELSGAFVKTEDRNAQSKLYSLDFSCPLCDYSFEEREARLFSFNSPKGACPACNGTGLACFNEAVAETESSEEEEPEEATQKFCSLCLGKRLRKEALQVKIKKHDIDSLSGMSIGELEDFLQSLKFSGQEQRIAEKIIKPLLERLSFLKQLSLSYLSLSRSLFSLSGGEAQRVRLASQLASPVIGVMYVLDEPSIGLHPKDHGAVLKAVQNIRDRGNTVVIVEHDEESIRKADKVIDLGPGAGLKGGRLIAEGTVAEIQKNKKSLTGAWLSGRKNIPLRRSRYSKKNPRIKLRGLKQHNLKNINVDIPLSCLIGVSGVSGSGKSSLVNDSLYPLLRAGLNGEPLPARICSRVMGWDQVERVVQISQRPIGRSPRSSPATYMGVFQMIRIFFSQMNTAKVRGLKPRDFSWNVSGGRCEACKGAGSVKLEMKFLPDVFTVCETCEGKRYQPDILNVTYKGKNIYDILNMSVDTAEAFFKNHPHIHQRLAFLKETGLGYMTLGQSSLSLSGGEAQRVKLSRELSKNAANKSFYILDEPTVGLHFQDVERLLKILRQLVEKGHTVLVIEHHLDILKSCDYLIDLGPAGGPDGGRLVAQGTPAELSRNAKSHTGRALKAVFKKQRKAFQRRPRS